MKKQGSKVKFVVNRIQLCIHIFISVLLTNGIVAFFITLYLLADKKNDLDQDHLHIKESRQKRSSDKRFVFLISGGRNKKYVRNFFVY